MGIVGSHSLIPALIASSEMAKGAIYCLGKQNRTTKACWCYSRCLHTSNSCPLISGTFHGQWALIKHLHSFKGVSLKGYCLGFLHRTHKKLQIQQHNVVQATIDDLFSLKG